MSDFTVHCLPMMPEVAISLLVFSMLVTLFLLIGAASSRTRKRPFMKMFISLLAAHILMQIGEAGIWMYEGKPEKVVLLKVCCVLSFGAGSAMIGLVTYCLLFFFRERKEISLFPAHIMCIFCIICFLLVVMSVWNGAFFQIDNQGNYIDGPYEAVIYGFDLVTFLAEIGLAFYYNSVFHVRGLSALLGFCIVDFVFMFLINVWYPIPMYLAITLFLILIYIIFHEELSRQISEKDKELAENRVAIMVSQIQSHFIYNSLNTIYHLCGKDVNLAKEAISDFSEYLKNILSFQSRTKPIPFETELQHVKTYLRLEKMRFDERLNVVYHIEYTEFLLPALSVQPLVENAVKHGICQKPEGGIVRLSTRVTEEYIEIEVSDDGVGFDSKKKKEDGKLHLGIQNVQQRLYAMCQGTLTVKSSPGQGTVILIRLPREN